jgi:DNA mismatch repair protein PMS2
VKELVENALDASATSLEVRFKNNGLDSIEIVDNGAGIAPEDFESLALKHYTSKLARYDDLTSLTTFGFRGEALSSLCAVSKLGVITSRAEDAPKGTKLEFETSGKVKSKSMIATQKGTTVTVEDIFRNLPVRRRELEKNIKREYGKVIGLLHAYACISTNVRLVVSNTPTKGKKMAVFSTNANATTRENIANVYGAKTLLALLPLDLTLELHPTTASTQSARNWVTQADTEKKDVHLRGHISRPVVGQGRQMPDRQMFFVNSRPCALPQVSKAINEVYRSYNITQSPFIFANLELDTNAYDVNVSPDKRSILLHDQTALLEALKESLTELFEKHDQSVPQAATPSLKRLPSFKPLAVATKPQEKVHEEEEYDGSLDSPSSQTNGGAVQPSSIIRRSAEGEDLLSREDAMRSAMAALAAEKRKEAKQIGKEQPTGERDGEPDFASVARPDATAASSIIASPRPPARPLSRPVQDFNARMGLDVEEQAETTAQVTIESESEDEPQRLTDVEREVEPTEATDEPPAATPEERIPSVSNTPQKTTPGAVPSAFDRMRPKRTPQDIATITIGNQTTSMTLGTPDAKRRRIHTPKIPTNGHMTSQTQPSFTSALRAFSAPGTTGHEDEEEDEIEDSEAAAPTTALANSRATRTQSARTHPLTSSMTATVTSLESDAPDPASESAKQLASELFLTSEDGTDDEYMDEAEKKAREEQRIAKLIELAEERAARPSSDNVKRATSAMKGRIRKDATLQLVQTLDTSVERIQRGLKQLTKAMDAYAGKIGGEHDVTNDEAAKSAEERLSLTVSKSDFDRMRIIGQFNLGFILATRTSKSTDLANAQDELFIIDQHASDEKYNFERLQSQTIVQNQRLVHPKLLDLTAIEEEIILNHSAALEKNGFEISIDTSGDVPVGRRCKLASLPMSREVTFSLSDLEELLALLAEHPEATSTVPRPSKVRKMFAMRACRSSIMVGKTLTVKQMGRVVTHMGELDKPWNCPHGRPTMRHLFSLDGWEGWTEGVAEDDEGRTDWGAYVEKGRAIGLLDAEEEAGHEEMEVEPDV